MGTKAEEAYARLSELIEDGTLRPGTFVSEATLMQEWGFGRTPLREAVQRLGSARLVHIRPGKGIQIPSNSVDEQLHRLEVRRVLEALAVALACERAGAVELAQIRGATEDLTSSDDPLPYAQALRRTQVMVADASHNEYLASALMPAQALSRRFWLAHLTPNGADLPEGRALHVAILDAITDRDADAARTASLALNDYLVSFTLDVATRHARAGWSNDS